MRRLHLVRHGLSAVDSDLPAHHWGLDPAGFDAIEELRTSHRIPATARWFSSPEPKALGTSRRLTDSPVGVVDHLREHERGVTPWFAAATDFRAVVRRAFDDPQTPAYDGWEPLRVTRDRLVPAVRRILAHHPDDEIVLVGHGTAWTLLKAELTGEPPDLEAWAALQMPDLWVLEVPNGSLSGDRKTSYVLVDSYDVRRGGTLVGLCLTSPPRTFPWFSTSHEAARSHRATSLI